MNQEKFIRKIYKKINSEIDDIEYNEQEGERRNSIFCNGFLSALIWVKQQIKNERRKK